ACLKGRRAHKCSGTPGSVVSYEVFLSDNFGLPGVVVDRQHNRGGLSEQRRRGYVSNPVVNGNPATNMVCETPGVFTRFVPRQLKVLADAL
ncbi:MAG: hypothetical protein JAY75_14995, partial [Candidatus Thiodiazotropha taylori]|nr:hypothetical protein [Candidatus Thiodiazotropha taylori]MCW4309522.1 hypothetical protein [Candidatus Thiodiazotropha endolucinida]